MRYLATFLLTVFSGVFAFVAKYFGRQAAMSATVAIAMLSITVAFYGVIKGLVGVSVSQITNPYLLMGFYALWPDNADTCIAICLGADVAAFYYRYQIDLLKMISS